ncbi:unnamed protein product [Protopolystoma xenopodis]|uniref:Acyltransferase 3 domain-containing protein n=1 Tax=Protopolystoma xenopodis TaxID=117903 RepID=A0A448WE84_9PLAT|nr:unnamed protein product [Protopolystoma xenopodis]
MLSTQTRLLQVLVAFSLPFNTAKLVFPYEDATRRRNSPTRAGPRLQHPGLTSGAVGALGLGQTSAVPRHPLLFLDGVRLISISWVVMGHWFVYFLPVASKLTMLPGPSPSNRACPRPTATFPKANS